MSPDTASLAASRTDPLYAALEARILDRDQKGASEIYYKLAKEGRPLPEMLREAVRIHAPYTHVPYHERIDDGYVNFVNNDHCLLSARTTLHLSKMLPGAASGLPMAQTIWYIPTGLDIWNQKIGKAPGHYSRGMQVPDGPPPAPIVHWPDQEPLALQGPLKERLGQWATLVHRGQVAEAYRVFLGLMAHPAERRTALSELVFAGLIDVQDRSFQNRSYTTGHKSFRARATVELGEAIGWENAHDVLYAGALDIAVGPRWYSLYEVACNAVTVYLEGQSLHAIPYGGTTEQERALLRNKTPLNKLESDALIEAVLRQPEPGYLLKVTELLKAGKDPRSILDALQIGAAEVVLETHGELNFSLPQHCYEYLNTLGWFWDTFDHPQRIKLLYLAAAYLNQNAFHQKLIGDLLPPRIEMPANAAGFDAERLTAGVEGATLALDAPKAVGWTKAYLESGHDRASLVRALALAATRLGNDPHNQEIALCMLEDYARNRSPDRDRLLLAAAQHTARHRKYGDPLDCSRRFGKALGLPALA
ncbi:MAG: hypothetical protein J0H44_02500 [Alphaproteobacteria bacterium]|nr:hypothetical protein [Alphaproteobacteria bacterium]